MLNQGERALFMLYIQKGECEARRGPCRLSDNTARRYTMLDQKQETAQDRSLQLRQVAMIKHAHTNSLTPPSLCPYPLR